MKTLTIKNLSIQVDFGDEDDENAVFRAKQSIEEINLALQREPHGLAAQIIPSDITPDDVEVEENDIAEDFDESEEL